MLSFLFIYALFLFAVACFLRVRIQVHQRYNNFQIVQLLAQGARICRTFPADTFLSLNCAEYPWGTDYCFSVQWTSHAHCGKRVYMQSVSFRADARHEEVNDILRNFLKFVEDHQTYA